MIRYSNQEAIRSQPLSERMTGALSFLPELGVEMEVFSGGQAAKGSGGPRTGSTRHDHGDAADVFFYKDGRRLDWSNPNDQPIFSEIVRRGKAAGLTGFGAGQNYMQPGSMHIGFGTPAVWGAGGKGSNAANWLREAYYGAGAPGVAAEAMAKIKPQGQQEQSMNLLNLSTRDSAPVQENQPWWNDDRRARLQMALEGMTLNPNQGVMYAAQQGLQERADARKENRVEQKQAKRAERTIAAMQAMGAPAELIALAEQDPFGAFSLAWEHKNRQPKSVTPYSAAGKLTSDYRSGLISEDQYRSGITALETQGGGSAAEETIGRIMEVRNPQTGQPFTRQEAIQIADLYTVSRHPQTGEAQLINKATGRPVGAAEQPDTSDGVTVPTLEPKSPQNVGDVPSALGAQGIGKTFVNRVGDFFGAGLAFPDAEEARSELNNLSTQTMLTLSGEWSGRPSNLTRERIEALTVKPNEFFTGKDSALIKLQDMRDLIGEAMISADRVERGQFSPTQKTEARQRQRALDQLYRAYSAIISNLEGGSGSGTTSGGIKWSIEQ